MQNKFHLLDIFLELLWRSLYLISFIIFFYIFISYLIITANPTTLFIDRQIFLPQQIRLILGLAFFLAFQGWVILKYLHKIQYHSPWGLKRTEKIILVCSAVILGYIYGGSLALPFLPALLIFIACSIGFIFLIPQLVNFYSYFSLKELKYFFTIIPLIIKFLYLYPSYPDLSRLNNAGLKQLRGSYTRTNSFVSGILQRYISISREIPRPIVCDVVSSMSAELKSAKVGGKPIPPAKKSEKIQDKKYTFIITKKQIRILTLISLSAFFGIFITALIFITMYKYTTGQIIRENKLRQTLHISSINPKQTTPGRTAVLLGYNFGIKTDNAYKILSDDELVLEIISWDKDRIEFIVPLSVSPGYRDVWIVKPIDELHRKQGIAKSNKVKIHIYSRFSLLPDVNDSKFERGVKKIKRYLIDTYPKYSFWIFNIFRI